MRTLCQERRSREESIDCMSESKIRNGSGRWPLLARACWEAGMLHLKISGNVQAKGLPGKSLIGAPSVLVTIFCRASF